MILSTLLLFTILGVVLPREGEEAEPALPGIRKPHSIPVPPWGRESPSLAPWREQEGCWHCK